MTYKTKADFCADIMAAARGEGWDAYSKQSGWDVLLMRREPHALYDVGDQMGIQVNLVLGVSVMLQALPPLQREVLPFSDTTGPHWRAIAAPRAAGRSGHARARSWARLVNTAAHLRLLVLGGARGRLIDPEDFGCGTFACRQHGGEDGDTWRDWVRAHYRWPTTHPCWIPQFVLNHTPIADTPRR